MGLAIEYIKTLIHVLKSSKKAADEVLETLGVDDPILAIKKLEALALEDEYFKSRSLYPNVDFYSGIIYRALGIPTDMFTVMFAIDVYQGGLPSGKKCVKIKSLLVDQGKYILDLRCETSKSR
jgi:citrate synthase